MQRTSFCIRVSKNKQIIIFKIIKIIYLIVISFVFFHIIWTSTQRMIITLLLYFISRAIGQVDPVSPGAPVTVSKLNASSYVGLWYQVYSNQVSTETFQFNGSCVTATYDIYPDKNNTFTVFNYQTLDSPDGPADIISGTLSN